MGVRILEGSMDGSEWIMLMMVLFLLCTLVLWGALLYVGVMSAILYHYLKRHHYHRWRFLTTIGCFGPGGANPVRGFRYIYSTLDDEHRKILQYKQSLRRGCRAVIWSLSIWFAIGFSIVLVGIVT